MMAGTLLDVFEISGRGCVVLVDIEEGACKVGDTFAAGSGRWAISGIEMVNYRPEALERIRAGWKPPTGLLLRGATKAELAPQIGKPCSADEEIAQ